MQVLKIDPIALRTAKTPRNFDSSECTRVNISLICLYVLRFIVNVMIILDFVTMEDKFQKNG